ncbi:MAG: tRNA lysidine(34) synthetase TilS [Candidatus Korobacteraceae bacterium]
MPYYSPVHEKVLRYIRDQDLLRAGDRVAAAVSGGADSVALLRVLLALRSELGIVLAVAHFNHGLRGQSSEADEALVAELATAHGLDFFAGHGKVSDYASTAKLGIEAAGRELRYRWFTQLAVQQRFDSIATAHTWDDQAETVLLKFLRGAGTRGLAGIYPILDLSSPGGSFGAKAPLQKMAVDGAAEAAPLQITVSPDVTLRIVRPLLGVSRQEVESYLESLAQSWREDESNLDHRFLRNRLRHELLPLLEREYNPKIRRLLNDVADTARAEEDYWRELAVPQAAARTSPNQLSLESFAQLPLALQRRVLKRFAESEGVTLDFAHIEKLRRCALGEQAQAEMPGGRVVVRRRASLQWRAAGEESAAAYWYVLPVPGEIGIAELGLSVRTEMVPEKFALELPQEELLNPGLVGAELVVRNWRPGDRFWPANSRSEEKLKRLFAEKHISAEERLQCPVAIHEDEIIWVRGFPVARSRQWKGNGDALRITTILAGAVTAQSIFSC